MNMMLRWVRVLPFLLPGLAGAVVPETGVYWNEIEPGVGYYIEHQNGIVALAIYAYNETDGEPEFFTAAGPLRDDANTFERQNFTGNLYPVHGMAADLVRSTGGACFACFHKPPSPAEKVGFVALAFPEVGTIQMIITTPGKRREKYLSRFAFGHDRLYAPFGPPDLRGQWVVVNELDPAQPALRYQFTERVSTPDPVIRSAQGYVVSYFDRVRNAELRCVSPNVTGLNDAQLDEVPRLGCELLQNGSVLWSVTEYDLGLYRFQAYPGPLPLHGTGQFRGAGRLIGVRIESR